jgi:NADPH:quinone reductase-like Zn-dependent oxidoreductase
VITEQIIMMKAWAVTEIGPATNLKVVELPKPVAGGRDLLIKLVAAATNPIDCKKRSTNFGAGPVGAPAVQGWDGCGVVEAVGERGESLIPTLNFPVSRFQVGDEVFFAGDVSRPGCNSEYAR